MTEQTPAPARSLAELIASGQTPDYHQQLDQSAKETLAEAGTPFTIRGVQFGDDADFGPYWQFEIELEGRTCTFRLGSHESRDPFVQNLASIAAQGPITNCRLRAASTRGGNKFLLIEPA